MNPGMIMMALQATNVVLNILISSGINLYKKVRSSVLI